MQDLRSTGLRSVKGYYRENRFLILVFILALVLRLVVLFAEGDRMFLGTDDDNYRESAEVLLRTGVLTYGGWPEPTVFIMPGYPVFLAVIFDLVGSISWLAVRLFQVIVSLVAIWFGAKLADYMGGRVVGLVTAMIMAVYPPNLTAPCFLMTEVLFTTLFLLSIFLFIRASESGENRWFLLTGFVLAVTTYFRPIGGPLPFIFAIYLYFKGWPWRLVFYKTFITGVVFLAVLSPWIIRNYIVYREFIPFTVSGGNPFLRGTYINGKITEKFPWVKGERILSDRAQMDYGRKRLVQGLRKDFKEYLRWYTVGKFKDFWAGPYYYKALTYLPVEMVNMFHRALLWTGVIGALLSLWQRKPAILLFGLICVYFTLLHMVYLTGPRYSFPVMQLVIVLSACSIVEGVKYLGLLCGRTD